MRFWYSTNRKDLESLSVKIGQLRTDKLNEEHIQEEFLPPSRWGTIRAWGGGFILDYSETYSDQSTLSTLEINITELVN